MGKAYDVNGISTNVELGKRGPRLKNNSDVIEHRNQDDDGFVVARGAHPLDENDFATKRYVDTHSGISVTGQIDGGSPPAVQAAGTVYVCTTAGGVYVLNTLYRSDGSSWIAITLSEGMTMVATDGFTGGTVEFTADHLYLWDEDGTSWNDIGPSAASSGVVKTARLTVTYEDTGVNLLKLLPAGAVASKIVVNVTQVWDDPLCTLIVGDTVDDDRLMTAVGNDLTKLGVQRSEPSYLYGSGTNVNITLADNGGTPSTGIAMVLINYDIA